MNASYLLDELNIFLGATVFLLFVRALSCNSEHALTLAEVNVHMKTH